MENPLLGLSAGTRPPRPPARAPKAIAASTRRPQAENARIAHQGRPPRVPLPRPDASKRFYEALGFEERGRLNFDSAYNVYMGLPGGGDTLELTVNVGR